MSKGWALITGASSGIGRATAREFRERGYSLLLVARRGDRLQELAKELRDVPVRTAVVDVTSSEQLQDFAKSQADIWDKIDILVNNAGLAKGLEKVDEAKLPDWDEMLDTNVRGLFHLTRLVLDGMVPRKKGHIVNLGSVAGRWVYPGGAIYCATKHAVRAFSEGLRQDLLGKNIRVSTIEPGMVNTEFGFVRFGDQAKADAVYHGMTPLSAEDIAQTIAWVVDRPGHVNIQEVVIYPTEQAHVGQVHRR